jgi:hypothetical protein
LSTQFGHLLSFGGAPDAAASNWLLFFKFCG